MAQIDGKWIKNNTVEDQHIRLKNDQYLRGRNNFDSADVNILKVKTDDLVEFATQPQFTGTPTVNEDLVNRGYVLDVLAGLRDPKDAVQLATTANITLSGEQSIDGILTASSRVLVKNQTTASENGIYISNAGAWTRSTDADTDAEVTSGMSCMVTEGTTNSRKLYVLTTSDPITLGVTALTFAQAPNPANFLVPKEYVYTLDEIGNSDITNGYIDLPHEAEAESIKLTPTGGPKQVYNTDYTVTVVANVSRVTFAGNFVTLAADGDELQISYSYATA